MLRAFIRRRPVVSYYGLALTIVCLVIVWQVGFTLWRAGAGDPFDYSKVLFGGLTDFGHGRPYANIISIAWVAATREPALFGIFVFATAPTVSAIVTSWLGWGVEGLKTLFARLKLWPTRAFRRDALTGYAVIAIVFYLMAQMHLALIDKIEGHAEMLKALTPFGMPAILFPLTFLIGGLIDDGATDEELGWRGFALPSLLAKLPPLAAALILGVIWWFWHFPREVPGLALGGLSWGFVEGQAEFLALVVAMTVVMTYFFHRTGSIVPAILLHGWGNFLTKDLGLGASYFFDDRGWLFVGSAICLVLVTGPRLGRDRYLALTGTAPA
jgi:membrane protease YdiL (CAAX protease family)